MSVSNFPLLRLGTADAYVETPWIAMADKNAMSVTVVGMNLVAPSGTGTFTVSIVASDDQIGTTIRGTPQTIVAVAAGSTQLQVGTVVYFGKTPGQAPLTSAWSKVRIASSVAASQGVFQISINTAID